MRAVSSPAPRVSTGSDEAVDDVQPQAPIAKPVPAAAPVAPKKIDAKAFAKATPAKDDGQALSKLAASKQPIGQANLTEALTAKLVRALPREIAGILQAEPHPGLRANPFDFAAVARNKDPKVQAAIAAYVSPDFAFSADDKKRAVLEQLKPVLLPNTEKMLARFHLPRAFSEASGQKPVTLAIEAEAGIQGRPQTLDYYAPDPDGLLDPRIITPKYAAALEKAGMLTKRPPTWARLSNDERADFLQWKDLTHDGRLAYLKVLQKEIDPNVTLYRIETARASPVGKVAPDTLRDKVKWEVSGAMKTAELITKSHYTSRDQLARDEAFIAGIGGKPPGFHYHCVLELDSEKDKKELGPKLAGLAAMTDLFLFTHDVRVGCSMLDHTHLEVFKADGVLEVMDAFGKEKIDTDKIMMHKFHLVGVRHGEAMYGNEHRLGLEIRAVPTGRTKMGQQVVASTLDIATSPALRDIDTDFWLEWNAGDKKVPNAAYEKARAACKDPALKAGAQLSFEELFEYAMDGRKTKDHFRLSAPFWNYEILPGITDAEKKAIADARMRYETKMLELSQALSVAIDSGREMASAPIYDEINRAVFTFMNDAKVDTVIKRHLDTLAAKGRES